MQLRSSFICTKKQVAKAICFCFFPNFEVNTSLLIAPHYLVEGNIIFKTGVSWVRNIVCYCDTDFKEKADEVVIGDLVVTDENKTKSYNEYVARKELVCYGIDDGNCRFLNSHHKIIKEYTDNNELVKEFAKVQLPDRFKKIRFNQLFISIIANLELFLSETVTIRSPLPGLYKKIC